MDFLKKALQVRFGALLTNLDNLFSQGVDQYARDVIAAHSLLINYRPTRGHVPKTPPKKPDDTNADNGELTFAQISTAVPRIDGALHMHIHCFTCKAKGHYANMCPNNEDVQLFQDGPDDCHPNSQDDAPDFTFTSMRSNHCTIPATWVLLGSQSTVSIFC